MTLTRKSGLSAPVLAFLGGLSLLSLLALGCKASTTEPYEPVVGTRLLMNAMIDPAADVLWDSVRTVMTVEGTEEFEPRTEEEWIVVRNAAIVLSESANLLMIGRRAVDEEDWLGWSYRLLDAGKEAMVAAESRDTQAVFDAGGEVYLACAGCHAKYWQSDFEPPEESAFSEKSQD